MKGFIHSIESCGTVDGPGLRYVIFTQGCVLRCQYCHNADTWEIGKGKEMTVEEIIDDVKTYLPFINASGGGITVSGGEPLLQIDFLTELFKACKQLGIHTAIDSSGGCYTTEASFQQKLNELLSYTDLILLDLKHIDEKKHRKLTGKTNKHILQFARFLSEKNVPVWIRHVLVPTITEDPNDLRRLAAFIRTLNNVKKIEILPYHKLGVYKWKALGLKYPLEGIEPPSEESVQMAQRILNGMENGVPL
ncbi:pyruvate formate-lyase-activating protein [Saccharococcus caldoxylosilyticus]|jgi:pyruvate formate lyase activating enzyme|uniref:Pyruvate formate-lyase-activating enzyme n=1 Tax=Parageobacillus caldoxylosilyticus NBRC 107762 TaxID=1220594 RepID=A0A023DB10_9BACL|nr:pyruvate formate-lyase-activating protein [Parageobacillus caldoxylosilyticus]MBB3851229.1 pyruvate formate lyase activating enzyme [Parageobacillus caldoxylosilyticus]QXJ38493.1 Pyruvate formate-lyase-activating enzyme [Parageobacillus caldoxylosilyticus]BDG45379.1 pyruvate formate-lyase-activating enzyme [Parageobacillus caldoxylosilyticus]GAJ38508.1 pyruvate formate-lyase activating enzyme [Parageobacillus caldoxylosilyticus NBRC 107762]